MKFRLKAFGVHISCSAVVLGLTLGALYLGWYHWPGWYLTDVPLVIGVMIGVDVVLGPSLTFIVANPAKPRRELARDISIIAVVQAIALTYGTIQLWNGRPLYYAFSENCLSIVQAYDLDAAALDLARRQKSPFAPHWYSLPRWIWAPLPSDSKQAADIVQSAISGGFDVTARPQYYKPWEQGLSELRGQLKSVDDNKFFSGNEKKTLKERMLAAGVPTDRRDTIALTGRGRPLLAVIDPTSLKIQALFKPT